MSYSLENVAKAIVNFMLGLVAVFLGLRFILKLFGANPANDFVNFIYEVSSEILGPFRGIFPSAKVEGFIIEFSTVFALLVYILIAMLAFYLIDILTPNTDDAVTEERVVRKRR